MLTTKYERIDSGIPGNADNDSQFCPWASPGFGYPFQTVHLHYLMILLSILIMIYFSQQLLSD